MGDNFDAISKSVKKEKPVSNAGGHCAISGCTEPATATNAVTGLAYAKWYCSVHLMAMNNGAKVQDLQMITKRLNRSPVKRYAHWADRIMGGVSKDQLIADDNAILNEVHEKAKF